MEGKHVIGCCCWETSKLPENWADYINDNVDELWVPCTHNEKVYRESGVTKPIRVVPYIFLSNRLIPKLKVKFTDTFSGNAIEYNDRFTFYTIGELNNRKGISDIICAFCEEFSERDMVRLILKVHYRGYSNSNKTHCERILEELIEPYRNSPPVQCIVDNVSDKKLLGLHSIGDCYVSLAKSEAFGLPIFDAFNYGKKIIATGYGGHVDFLSNTSGLVNYTMEKVQQMESKYYDETQEWAIPDMGHAKQLMRQFYEEWKGQF